MREEIKEILKDRFEGWELVEFLQISCDDIVETFEELIEENLQEILEEIQYTPKEEDSSE